MDGANGPPGAPPLISQHPPTHSPVHPQGSSPLAGTRGGTHTHMHTHRVGSPAAGAPLPPPALHWHLRRRALFDPLHAELEEAPLPGLAVRRIGHFRPFPNDLPARSRILQTPKDLVFFFLE
jgi:hypothetical protein